MKHEPMTAEQRLAMKQVVLQVAEERYRQHELWGEQNLAIGADFGSDGAQAELKRFRQRVKFREAKGDYSTWHEIMTEEMLEVLAETDRSKLKTEAIQLAAVLVQFVEFLDRTA